MQLMTQAEYAEYRDVSQPMISKYIKQGKITNKAITFVNENGKKYKRIIVAQADIDLKNNLDPAQTTSRKNPDKPAIVDHNLDSEVITFEQARTINEVLKAELNKIKLAIEQGKYIEAEKVESEYFQIARKIRDSIEAIPVRVAALVAAESNQFACQQILESEFKNILVDLANTIKDAS